MAYKMDAALSEGVLAAIKAALDDGFMHLFAGPVPADPADALDLDDTHTFLGTVSVDDDGTTGLTFAAPSGATMTKAEDEDWLFTTAFDGADEGEATLDATFFRYCTSGDDGRDEGTAPRLQGTIGTTGSGADMERSTVALADATQYPVSGFIVRAGSVT